MVIHDTRRLAQAGNRELETHYGAMPPTQARLLDVARRESLAIHNVAAFRVGDARWSIVALPAARS